MNLERFCTAISLTLMLVLIITSLSIINTTTLSLYNIIYLVISLLSLVSVIVYLFSKEKNVLKHNHIELEKIAFSDPLTLLLNRRAIESFIDKMIARYKRSSSKFAILYLDLDNFKPINDTFGHAVGDKVLIEVALRLKKLIRENDAIGRIGGDEFIILLDDINESEQASVMAERIVNSFATSFDIDGHVVSVSFSIGISIYPDNGEYRLSLFKAADMAMYQAKERGKNCYKFYTNELDQRVKKNIALDNALHHALENNEFSLVYQPRINLLDSNVKEAEALIRWNRPNHGTVMPSEFISRAEKNGLILKIGEWVINRVCEQCKQYYDEGMPTQISINVSIAQLKDDAFVGIMQKAIKKNAIKASLIELEMSESFLMQEAESLMSTLHALKNLGIELAVDEFGKGYSSMGYMKRLPINKIKIDKSLINEILINKKDKELVSAMIALGHVLGLSVVAEGVEVDKHLEMSRALQIDSAQGYFLAKPLEADILHDFYKTFNSKVA